MVICPNISMKQCVGFDAEIWLNRAHVYEDLPNLQNLMVDNVHLNVLATHVMVTLLRRHGNPCVLAVFILVIWH